MKALISANRTQSVQDATFFGKAVPSIRTGDLRIFTQASSLCSFPTDEAAIASIYCPHPAGLFSEVYVGESNRLLRNSWGRSFLRFAMHLVGENGKLMVAALPEEQARAKGAWSPESLAQSLGTPEVVHGKGALVAVFDKIYPPLTIESTLDWYIPNATSVHILDILLRANAEVSHYEAADYGTFEFLYGSAEKVVGRSRRRAAGRTRISGIGELQWLNRLKQIKNRVIGGATNPEVGDVRWHSGQSNVLIEPELSRAALEHAYYVGGVSYKSALLKHVISTLLPNGRDLRAVDFGGGYGLLMAELLLDKGTNVSTAVVRDHSSSNLAFAAAMFRHLRKELKGRFYFSLGKSEGFQFDEQFDVVSFVGSLLYIAKDDRAELLKRCWEALSPGGLLVVHENIKKRSYVADYDLMFTPSEIDGLLGQFGKVRYFSSTSTVELPESKVGNSTVFRAVQKEEQL